MTKVTIQHQPTLQAVRQLLCSVHLLGSTALLLLAIITLAGFIKPAGSAPYNSTAPAATPVACKPTLVAADENALHSAFTCINHAITGTYTISIAADITYTTPISPLQNAQLTRIAIKGNGHTLNAAGHGRVLVVAQFKEFSIHNLTLTGGVDTGSNEEADGGGISLLCEDDLVCLWQLEHVTLHHNQAANGGGLQYRCGYHGDGSLIINHSNLYANEARQQGGGLFYSSDEESFSCTLEINNTLIEQNLAEHGGGLRSYSPRITISNSTIRNNRALLDGGGILLRKSDGFIDMVLRNSAIYGNLAGRDGGGLNITSFEQIFEIQLANSTISNNQAPSGRGGGLYLSENNGSLQINLVNSTVAGNQAAEGGGIFVYNQEGGNSPSLYLANALIADNQEVNCGAASTDNPLFPPFTGERIVSRDNNLDSDGTCLVSTVRQPADQLSINPQLAPLADNGGTTWTHALLPSSPAIDSGKDFTCARPPVYRVDQRGQPRPIGTHCDIGAYEAGTLPPLLPLIYLPSIQR